MKVTAAAPEDLVADSNQLAMVLSSGPADAYTYVGLNWVDEDGNLYAAASWETTEAWVEFAMQPLVRPAWDTDDIIDMDAAQRAQDALVYSTVAIPATPTALTAIGGPDGLAALAMMGLTQVPVDV